MDRRDAIESLAPVHAHALRLLDDGVECSVIAARLGLDVAELATLVRVAEAKVDRLLHNSAPPSVDGVAAASNPPLPTE